MLKSFLEFVDDKPVQAQQPVQEQEPVQGRNEEVERRLEEMLSVREEIEKLKAKNEELERRLQETAAKKETAAEAASDSGIAALLNAGSTRKVITSWSAPKAEPSMELPEQKAAVPKDVENVAKMCGFVERKETVQTQVQKPKERSTFDITAPIINESFDEPVPDRPLTDAEKLRRICGL